MLNEQSTMRSDLIMSLISAPVVGLAPKKHARLGGYPQVDPAHVHTKVPVPPRPILSSCLRHYNALSVCVQVGPTSGWLPESPYAVVFLQLGDGTMAVKTAGTDAGSPDFGAHANSLGYTPK